jgi:hypothetical protein
VIRDTSARWTVVRFPVRKTTVAGDVIGVSRHGDQPAHNPMRSAYRNFTVDSQTGNLRK